MALGGSVSSCTQQAGDDAETDRRPEPGNAALLSSGNIQLLTDFVLENVAMVSSRKTLFLRQEKGQNVPLPFTWWSAYMNSFLFQYFLKQVACRRWLPMDTGLPLACSRTNSRVCAESDVAPCNGTSH